MKHDYASLTLADQARLLQQGEVKATELASAALERIEKLDSQVNAFITVMSESAMREAEAADAEIAAGKYRGGMHGIPVGLKDLICTKGVRTTVGSDVLRDFVPAEDAEVVTRLKAAGAVIIGKTNMHEFAYGPTNLNGHYGDVRNPWNPDRISGGSSGGSGAAVAARMLPMAIGSDTGGSIRIPASLCGITGIKPTYGRVSRHGTFPCAWSLDHLGPMCQTAEDAAIALQVMAGYDEKDAGSSHVDVPDYLAELNDDVRGLPIAILTEYVEAQNQPAVRPAFANAVAAFRELGLQIEEISVPDVKFAMAASTAIQSAECSEYHRESLRLHGERYGADVRERIESGYYVSGADYVRGQRIRRQLNEQFAELFKRYRAIIYPSLPVAAFRRDTPTVEIGGKQYGGRGALVGQCRLFNLVGTPVISLPSGFDEEGLPLGLQLATAAFDEVTALRLGHAFQKVTDFHRKRPPIS